MKTMEVEMQNPCDKCDKIEESLQKTQNNNDSRFDYVKYKQKFHEILPKSQKW